MTVKRSLSAIVLFSLLCSCSALPTLEPNSPVFNISDTEGQTCISASFNMTFNIYVNASTNNEDAEPVTFYSPTASQGPDHTGSCGNSSMQYLRITWTDKGYQFILTMEFTTNSTNGNWSLTRLALEFDPHFFSSSSDLVTAANGSTLVFETVETSWWNRTFTTDQFFYCKHCKELPFNVSSPVKNLACLNNTDCSYAGLKNAVIYVGTVETPIQQQCIEDYLAVRELIVPIVVGGLLLLLLIGVSLAYLVAFLKRRFRDRHTHYHHLEDD